MNGRVKFHINNKVSQNKHFSKATKACAYVIAAKTSHADTVSAWINTVDLCFVPPCLIGELSDQFHLCTITRNCCKCLLQPKELWNTMGPVTGYISVSAVSFLVNICG